MGKVMISGVAPQMTVPKGLPPIGTALNDMTWEQIQTISDAGKAADYFNVGDTKNITLDGVSYPVQIIGFNHDTKTDGGTAGITFQMVDCLNSTYQMNSSDTNSGGWTSCAMRTSTMATLLSQLASDLKNAIVKVKKLSSAGNQSTAIYTTEDSLFLLSEVEIFGSTTHAKAGEGSQYEYYQSGNSRVKTVNRAASTWWERSPDGSAITNFCGVSSNGIADHYIASSSYGVSFGFCV